MTLRNTFWSAVFAAALSPLAAAESETADPNKPISFYSQVRPIFQGNCQGCHQPAKAKGGYVMTSFESLLKGGDESEGSAIVPGKPTESFLIEQITPVDGEVAMPPKKGALSDVEVELVHKWIAEGAKDDTPENAKQRYTMDKPPVYSRPPVITSLDFSPDGTLLAVAGFHEVLLHNADGSGLVSRLVGLSERIESVRFSPDGGRLAVTGGLPARMGEVQVWDVDKKKLALSRPVTYDTVYGASWSPDGNIIAFGCSDNTVRAIDSTSGEQVLFQGSHSDWVFDTSFGVDGKHVVSVARDMTAKLIEFKTQRFVDNITSITPKALKGGIQSVVRHPLRDEILVGGADGVPKLYQMHRTTARRIGDDANLLLEFPAQKGRLFTVSISKDGSKIAGGSSLDGKGEIGIHQIDPNLKPEKAIKDLLHKPTHERNGDENKKLQGYYASSVVTLARLEIDTGIYASAFSPDGATLAAAGADGVIRLINTADGKVAKEFVPVEISKEVAHN